MKYRNKRKFKKLKTRLTDEEIDSKEIVDVA